MIRVAEPALIGREKEYVLDCLNRNQLTFGPYVQRFEKEFAQFVGTRYALATSNGTVALHLVLVALGIKQGDQVITPNITYVATANAAKYCGAEVVLVDIDKNWCMDPEKVRKAITLKTKAIIPVHLYGHPASMDEINEIAKIRNIPVIEDAAESFGSEYKGHPTGSLGLAGTFSFFGNKTITCGEGGMITTSDDGLYERMKHLRAQAMDPNRRYWHTDVGYNYRMTDIQAAIGVAQLEKANIHIHRRQEVAYWYKSSRDVHIDFQSISQNAKVVRWMVAGLIPKESRFDRDEVIKRMAERGIETRPVFPCLSWLPMYKTDGSFERSIDISARGICLPTHANLIEYDVALICSTLREILCETDVVVGDNK